MTNKLFNRSFNLAALLLALLFTGLYSCSEKITSEEATVSSVNQLKSVTLVPATTSTNIVVVPLLAGQTTVAGNVTIQTIMFNGVLSLNVTYNLTGGWAFQNTADALKLWVGTALSNMPQNSQGQPKIGQFPYKLNASGTTATINIPLSDFGYVACKTLNLFVAAHADVIKGTQTQTAWAQGTGSAKGSWWTYFKITIKNDAPVIAGSLPDMEINGCSASDVPAAVNTLNALKALNPTTPLDITDDSFGLPLTVTYSDATATGTNSCDGYTVIRTYTVSDECNSATVTQKIVIKDKTAPVLSGQGANQTIGCADEFVFTAPTALDGCKGTVAVTAVSPDVVSTTAVAGITTIIQTRTWTATDGCNTSSVTQTITKVCGPPPGSGNECTSWTEDTGFGGNASGAGNSWWYYYDGIGQETIWAGQTKVAGTVEKTGGNLVITLAPGWELQPVAESVKVQGYNALPAGRPSAGQFTTYKGTSLTVAVGQYTYYVVHLDVRKCTSFQ